MKKMLMVFVMFTLTFKASASTTTHGEVARIYPSGDKVFFRLKDNASCNPNNRYYHFTLDTEVKRAWYSLILAAANTGGRVSVKVLSCPTTDNVQIQYVYQDF